MTRQRLLAGLTTLAVVCGAGSAAWADPYADEQLYVNRVTSGTAADGTAINTSWDYQDNGLDAVGPPNSGIGRLGLMILGYDANSAANLADDQGGQLALGFTDNVCADGPGPDIRVHEVGDNESAKVEVSDDGGQSFKEVGHVGPNEGYELDIDGKAGPFTQIRLTATDHAGTFNTAGIDVDAVECLHSPVEPDPTDTAKAEPDGCDLVGSSRWYSRGRRVQPLDPGIDVEDVSIDHNGTSIEVTLDLCGEMSNRTVYAVYLDYVDRTNMDNDRMDDGPDTLDGNMRCRRTYDHTAYYYRGRERGGYFNRIEDGNGEGKDQLVVTVDYVDMNRATLVDGSEVLLWVETRGRGYVRDHVPTTEAGDRCSRPQIEKEVFRVTLGGEASDPGEEEPGEEPGNSDPGPGSEQEPPR